MIEIMLAMLLLLILALGGAAYIYHSIGYIGIMGTKRLALEVANSRLETMRTAGFDNIKPLSLDYDVHYIDHSSSAWAVSTADPDETVDIKGISLPITTTVQYVDEDPTDGIDSYDYLLASVSVGFRVNSSEQVTLTTYLGRYR
ncbi:MAG: hypothetical protein JW869_00775 [Candidatus Omnitrophica bacterium]|nr:hypothetical protein [Candidatus Omnitrophota bacterium]